MAAFPDGAREIEKQRIIGEADFANWLSPVAVIAMAESLNFYSVALRLGEPLVAGQVRSAATTLNFEGATVHRGLIPHGIWRGWPFQDDTRFWVTGDFQRAVGGASRQATLDRQIQAYGVQFDPEDIGRAFPAIADRPAGPLFTKGKRRAGTNGEPIARAVRRLIALPSNELPSYKVELPAGELAEEYWALGLNPPHEDNAERDAAGILRALREGG